MTETEIEIKFNPAFEIGVARIRRRKHQNKASTHLINPTGTGLVCLPNKGYDSWTAALPGVTDPDCKKCIKLDRK